MSDTPTRVTSLSRAIVRFDVIEKLAELAYSDKTPGGDPMGEGYRCIFIEPHPVAGCVLMWTDRFALVAIHDRSASFGGLARTWTVPVKQLGVFPPRTARMRAGLGTRWCDLAYTAGSPSTARLVASDSSSEVLSGGGHELACVDDTETKMPIMSNDEAVAWRYTLERNKPSLTAPTSWFDPSYLGAFASLAKDLSDLKRTDKQPMAIVMDGAQRARLIFHGVPQLLVVLAATTNAVGPSEENPRWLDELISPPFRDADVDAAAAD